MVCAETLKARLLASAMMVTSIGTNQKGNFFKSFNMILTNLLSGDQCVDKDECEISQCGDHMVCTNTVGSFECSCRVEIRMF